MQRYAVVLNGVVANVVMWDGASECEAFDLLQLIPIDDRAEVGIGWGFDGNEFYAPQPQSSVGVV
ncbi:hypothetical protein PMO31116_02324 [Pandoraea morbifera]|uniref:Uncharacterized protein n=1 Tax=Pandoraea morbifera TaxID=2508300 RepID=A0A5E4V2A3_9BURK|nr:hypothetical protein PMO31116_02324 [Pandoraea morbifera]